MVNKSRIVLIVAQIFIVMAFAAEVLAGQVSIEDFLGEYQGVSVEDSGKIWLPADLNVSIRGMGATQPIQR